MAFRKKQTAGQGSLYGRDALKENPTSPVLMVNDVKSAKFASKLISDYVVVSRRASQTLQRSDLTPLKDRDVTIWLNNRGTGKESVSDIVKACTEAGCSSIRRVSATSALPRGWDFGDPVPEEVDLRELIEIAPHYADDLSKFLLSAKELSRQKIKPREMIVNPFFPVGSINLVFAQRGLGKTWFVLTLAKAIANGEPFLGYELLKSRRVLFVDGEMALSDLQGRIRAIGAENITNLEVLPSEVMYRDFHPLNINEAKHRQLVTKTLDQMKARGRAPEFVIFDNLSSLRMGADENDNSGLDEILGWLMSLRHKGYSVLLVHHTGKKGGQRGASRLEDMLDTTIKLSPLDGSDSQATSFEMSFEKTRGLRPNPDKQVLTLVKGERGVLGWQHSAYAKPTAADAVLLILYQGVGGDRRVIYKKQLDVAKARDMQEPAISKHLSSLRANGYVGPKDLKVTEKGKERLQAVYPNESIV